MEIKAPYRTNVVKPELLERTIDTMFYLSKQRNCDIRDISQLDIYKKAKINRKTFTNNFHGIGGIHRAVAEDVKRYLTNALRITDGSEMQINTIFLMRLLTELEAKKKEVDYSILSSDWEFWITSVSAMEPLLRKAWTCCSEQAYQISLQMYAAIFNIAMVKWSEKRYDPQLKGDAAALLHEYCRQVEKINRDLRFFIDSIELLR